MSSVETGQTSYFETREKCLLMRKDAALSDYLNFCCVSAQSICPVSAADIRPVSTADIYPLSTENIYPVSAEDAAQPLTNHRFLLVFLLPGTLGTA